MDERTSLATAVVEEKQIKILFIDDDEMMRIFFRDIFWIHGKNDRYQITLARTLIEADNIIKEPTTRPDIIFLDMMVLPEKRDGFSTYSIEKNMEFIKKIKSDSELSKIRVVVFSIHRDEALQKKLLGLGADGYLIKGSLMPKEIIDFVESLKVG